MAIERTDADTRALRYIAWRYVNAHLRERRLGRFEQQIAIAKTIGAQLSCAG
jgi:hypothetical protein